MKWSLGPTALLLALAAGAPLLAAEPAGPAPGEPVARPAIWPGKLGFGFLSGNHVRPVSNAAGGEIVAGEHYGGGVIAGGDVYGPGSCECQPPCVNHLWDGYVQRPRRCGHFGHHGRGCQSCGAGYSGFGCGCGLKLGSWFGSGCDSGCGDACETDCGAVADCGACGRKPLFGGCKLFGCGGHSYSGLGCGCGPFKHGGLGKFWASCFGGDDCGCGVAANCGCADAVQGQPAEAPHYGGETLQRPVPRELNSDPDQDSQLELNEEPVPPAPKPDEEDQKSAARRPTPAFRGFSGFGLK